MNSSGVASELYNSIINGAKREALGRMRELSMDFNPKSLAASTQDNVSKEDLAKADKELLNSVSDAKQRLEARVLRQEASIAQHRLAAKEFEYQASKHSRAMPMEVAWFSTLAQVPLMRQKRDLAMAIRNSAIELKRERCHALVQSREAVMATTLQEIDSAEGILRRVRMSSESLTIRMRREGFQTVEAMSAATEATAIEAAAAESELRKLRLKIIALEERLRTLKS